MYQLEIQGRCYALGLWWQVREGGQAPRKVMLKFARATAQEFKESHYNCVSLRKHQVGLGHWGEGKLPVGMPSLAAALKPSTLRSISIFCLELPSELSAGLWWVCSVQQGTISADGDRLCESFAAAKQLSRELQTYMRECDQELICLTPEESMSAILSMIRPEARVEALYPDPNQKKNRVLFALVLAGLLTAAVGIPWFLSYREAERAHEAMLATQVRNRAKKADILADPSRYFPRSWELEPLPSLLILNCLTDMQDLSIVSHGWLLEAALCTNKNMGLTWLHQPGASYAALPSHSKLIGPTQAVATLSRRADPAQAKFIELSTVSILTRALYQLTQDAGFSLRLKWREPESLEVDGLLIVAPWKQGDWEMLAVPVALLAKVGEALGRLPGVSVHSIQYNNNWSIRGVIYAHP